jgi:hypothetical protein
VSTALPLELQAPLKLVLYEALAASLTVYVPAESEYKVPGVDVPAAGLPDTSDPELFITWILKLEGVAVPPPVLVTDLMT